MLVAKGHTKTYSVDYGETFVLPRKMNSVRIILSLATYFGLEFQQFDLKMFSCMNIYRRSLHADSSKF